jgi:Xaa-Pro aminopeptidase
MIIDLASIVDQMRCVKSENEIAVMQHAADISSKAHIRAMQYSKPQLFEYQVEAELIHEFMINGAAAPAYLSIVASGINGCTLHYIDNNSKMKNGDLLLIDAGREWKIYSGTKRPISISVKFTKGSYCKSESW